MQKIYFILSIILVLVINVAGQTTIQNGDFENWDNAGTDTEEPAFFNSNKTGTDWATNGPQTCYRDNSTFHSGSYSCRTETKTFIIAIVNGSLTTGIVNAPTTNKADGYIGTMKGTNTSDIRRMSFTGRPDSLIGWYKYTQGGGSEKGKIVAYLHVGNYYDPPTATANHPDSSANRIATALYNTPSSNVATWTRFAVPFVYVDGRTPQYIMINATPSDDQLTSVAGSKLWLDDLEVVYAGPTGVNHTAAQKQTAKVYCFEKILYVDFIIRKEEQSRISIYDVTGKVVAVQKISNHLSTINVSTLNSGMYLYQITGTDFQKSGKFFIE